MILTAKLFSQEFNLEHYLTDISYLIDDKLIKNLANSSFLENVSVLNLDGAKNLNSDCFLELYKS
jgi:hypothetical protein